MILNFGHILHLFILIYTLLHVFTLIYILLYILHILLHFLLSQRESFVTVKIFVLKILMNFDVFEDPESE